MNILPRPLSPSQDRCEDRSAAGACPHLRPPARHQRGHMLRSRPARHRPDFPHQGVDAWDVAANDPKAAPLAPDLPHGHLHPQRLTRWSCAGVRHGPPRWTTTWSTCGREQRPGRRDGHARRRPQGPRVHRRARPGHHGQDQRPSRSRTRRRPPPRDSGWIGKTALFVSPGVRAGRARPPTPPTLPSRPARQPVRMNTCSACRECAGRRARPAAAATCTGRQAWRATSFDAGACRHHMNAFHERRTDDLRHLHRRLPVLRRSLLTPPA